MGHAGTPYLPELKFNEYMCMHWHRYLYMAHNFTDHAKRPSPCAAYISVKATHIKHQSGELSKHCIIVYAQCS